MDDETEDQRRARQDGTQLAFSTVLRELVRSQYPNEQIRQGRREKIRRGMEAAHGAADTEPHAREALLAAMAAIDSIYAPGKG